MWLRELLRCSALRERRGWAKRHTRQYENSWCRTMGRLAFEELANNMAKGIACSVETGNAGLWHEEASRDHPHVYLVLERRLARGGGSVTTVPTSLTEERSWCITLQEWEQARRLFLPPPL